MRLIIALIFLFLMFISGVFAASCGDLLFYTVQKDISCDDNFTVVIQNADASPEIPWGEWQLLSLTSSEGLMLFSEQNISLQNKIMPVHVWTLGCLQENLSSDKYMPVVTAETASIECNYVLNLPLGTNISDSTGNTDNQTIDTTQDQGLGDDTDTVAETSNEPVLYDIPGTKTSNEDDDYDRKRKNKESEDEEEIVWFYPADESTSDTNVREEFLVNEELRGIKENLIEQNPNIRFIEPKAVGFVRKSNSSKPLNLLFYLTIINGFIFILVIIVVVVLRKKRSK